jgi:hypothetical protein
MSSYDAVRLWLNDRLGERVELALMLDRGESSVFVLGFTGELRHFQETKTAERWRERGNPRQDMGGSYSIGTADVDFTELEHLDGWELGTIGTATTARLSLGDDLYLEIAHREIPSRV